MKTSKKIKIGFGALLIVILFLFFHYNLPRTSVVQISGTDTKRVDKAVAVENADGGKSKKENIAAQTVDVRYINSVSRKGKPMVFHFAGHIGIDCQGKNKKIIRQAWWKMTSK